MPKNKFNVLWSEVAERDLISIIEYILKDNKTSAIKIYESIKKASLDLDSFTQRGRIVPELEYFFINNYREIIIKFWRIIYRIEGNNVYILAVLDSRRNIEDLLLKRLLI
ncbi:MAG: type II toxin-antitoxin system RelE/ParE family toxin [Spirochaetia bacterium]|nr:type II toxin-antitoxin system RelE/ParE family toxin [Spirochaetia bacterium]